MMDNPIDMLPIKRPLEDSMDVHPEDFYRNVVRKLIPDIIRVKANGIPIDLERVQVLEHELDTVLESVSKRLKDNPVIQRYLKQVKEKEYQDARSKRKVKTAEDFYKEYNSKNKIHRSYVINYYLRSIGRDDLVIPEWSVKDMNKLAQILSDNFIEDFKLGGDGVHTRTIVDKAMQSLAEEKAAIYNKQIEGKLDKLKDEDIAFNPASPKQKQELFAMLGIESENTTDTGNAKWDKKELAKLQKHLEMLKEK